MIVDKIYEFIGPNTDKETIPKLIEEYKEEIGRVLVRQAFSKREQRATLRVSSLGKCIREQAYTLLGYEPCKEVNARSKVIFLMGDIIEALVIVLAKHAGVELGYEQEEVDFYRGVLGHTDGRINGDIVFECKSMNERYYQQFSTKGLDDDRGYISQVQAYMHGLGLKQALVVGMNKNTGHLHEQIIKYDRTHIYHLENTIDTLLDVQKGIIGLEDLGRIDPVEETFYRKKTGNLKLHWKCSYCDYMDYCWTKDKVTLCFRKGKPIYYITDSFDITKAPKGTKISEV